MKSISFLFVFIVLISCQRNNVDLRSASNPTPVLKISNPSIIILGTIQDAGSPHIGCTRDCCIELFNNPDEKRKVVSLGLIDPENGKRFIIDATPDFTEQLYYLNQLAFNSTNSAPDGIFLTHAHIGHYTGLMYLGREAMNAPATPVYAMPKMKSFLEQNGPWDLLVSNNNIKIQELSDSTPVKISSNIEITPLTLPHRGEYSETVGYLISGPNKKVLFIPDIDKWNQWNQNIVEIIEKVDYAFIDATFFDENEINHRNIAEIPHPFIIESMSLFKNLSDTEKCKIHFIHFNHTNPVLNPESDARAIVIENGFNIASFHDVIEL